MTRKGHDGMAEHEARRTPLADATDRLAQVTHATGGAITMAEVPFLTQVNLRLDPAGPAAAAAGKELGLALPTEAGSSARSGDVSVLWLGPDEWLVVDHEHADALAHHRSHGFEIGHACIMTRSGQRPWS